MTNEMKLLTAFIKASGFDVETIDVTYINGTRDDEWGIAPITPMDKITHANDYKVTRKDVEADDLIRRFLDEAQTREPTRQLLDDAEEYLNE